MNTNIQTAHALFHPHERVTHRDRDTFGFVKLSSGLYVSQNDIFLNGEKGYFNPEEAINCARFYGRRILTLPTLLQIAEEFPSFFDVTEREGFWLDTKVKGNMLEFPIIYGTELRYRKEVIDKFDLQLLKQVGINVRIEGRGYIGFINNGKSREIFTWTGDYDKPLGIRGVFLE